MHERRICYLDNNATTPVAREVVDAMLPFLRERWANPSSAYTPGRDLVEPLDEARARVASLIGAEPGEIIFTSCGTESNNTALASALAVAPAKRHVVTTAVEHSATVNFCEVLRRRGCEVTLLPVSAEGSLDLPAVEKAIRPDTAIVSVMLANNETGVIFPVAAIAEICRAKGVPFHTDAVQAAGKVPIDVQQLGVDFLSLSAHKLYAPKGIGLLYVRRRTRFQPYIVGGHQEKGRRGGTENVPYQIAFGQAAVMAAAGLEADARRLRQLRDRLEIGILEAIPGSRRNGAAEPRLPNTTNIAFEDVEAEAVLMLLDQAGICASSGSACTTGSLDPSHVLSAMGLSRAQARGSLRLSLGRYNTDADVDHALHHLPRIIAKLRALAPLNPHRRDVAAARG